MRISRDQFSVRSTDNLHRSELDEFNKKIKQQKLLAKMKGKRSKK